MPRTLGVMACVSLMAALLVMLSVAVSSVAPQRSSMRIAIVGGGPSGLALANGLARRGFSAVSVFERRDSYNDHLGTSVGLAPNGLRALSEVSDSLLRSVLEHGCKLQSMRTITEEGEQSAVRPFKDTAKEYGFSVTTIQWWRMRELLYNDLPRNDLVHFSKKVTSITEHSDSVSLVFSDGSIHECDLVVAADGVHSTVRRHLGLPDSIPTKTLSYRGSGSVPSDGSPFLLDDVEFCNLLKPPSQLYIFRFGDNFSWVLNDGSTFSAQDEVESKLTPEQALAKLRVVYQGPLEKQCVALLERTDPMSMTRTHGFILEPCPEAEGFGGRGRIVLIGDAAHAMPAFDGLGGNLAFEDCLCLIRELVKEGDLSDLVTRFEKKRFQRVLLLHQNQHRKHLNRMNKDYKASPEDSKGLLEGGLDLDDRARDWIWKGI